MDTQRPRGISIVVAAYRSSSHLQPLLESAVRAAAQVDCPTEMLVVDTSPEGSEESQRSRELCQQAGATWICGNWRSVARSRNEGARRARYDKLFFVDSDCRLRSETLREHLDVLVSERAVRCGGTVGLTTLHGPLGWAGKAICATPFVLPFRWAAFAEHPPWGTTSNLMVFSDVFAQVGGFDEHSYAVVGGEDVDLGWRICDAEKPWIGVPRAEVLHVTETWNRWTGNLRRAFRYGVGDHYLARKHPHRTFRDPLSYPVFFAILFALTALGTGLGQGQFAFVAAAAAVVTAWLGAAVLDACTLPDRPALFYALLGELLLAVYDTGYFVSAIRQRDALRVFLRVGHGKPHVRDCRQRLAIKLGGAVCGVLAALAWARFPR